MIQAAFVDMQNMFDLLDVDSEVKHIPNALPLSITRGHLEVYIILCTYSWKGCG